MKVSDVMMLMNTNTIVSIINDKNVCLYKGDSFVEIHQKYGDLTVTEIFPTGQYLVILMVRS